MHATDYLQKYFGYPEFRKGQAELIDTILAHRDVLGIMPTGAGKSICYQIPALMLDGMTIVVSPLISLMQDQVDTLRQLGIPSAYLNSTLSPADQTETLYAAQEGAYKLLYVAPERLLTPTFLDFAQHANLAMVTIDEAHCVSQWGQNFRPNYLDIATFLAALPHRPIVSAFTATATGRVKEDIASLLNLQAPAVFVTGFDRENLYFSVEMHRDRSAALLKFLKKKESESGIIYCSTRKTVEKVCAELQAAGFSAAQYHAGLPTEERSDSQREFLFDRIKIMVATNAFGMGIDKSNISFVVHYNMPKDVESYYQEAGRAGRDGSPADCVLYYSAQDVVLNQRLIRMSEDTTPEQIERELARLSQMTFYCTTTDCLRGFILHYFGETPPPTCGHCGNCDADFDEIDITIDAQKIISCVIRAEQRFGAGMIVDILRGVSTERIQRLGLDQLSTYGISDQSVQALRKIIEFLLSRGYLQQSEGQYPVLQRTAKAAALLKGTEQLTMPVRKDLPPTRAVKRAIDAQLPVSLAPLFEALRGVRSALARAQEVPAYVIFTDKTLHELCLRMPQTETAFLTIGGISERKCNEYGAAFLDCITSFCTEHNIQPQEIALEASHVLNTATAKKAHRAKASKELILPTTEVLASIKPMAKKAMLRDMAALINEVLDASECSRISAPKISNWLIAQALLEVVETESGKAKHPTALGTEQGITTKSRKRHDDGTEYQVNFYPTALQQNIIDHVCDILQMGM